MPLFVSSPSQASYPGVVAILISPPRVIRGTSLGYIGLIGQFTAGPVFSGYLPQSGDDLVQTFEPRGVPRKSTGYYAIMQRLSAPWLIVGVKGAGYATAATSQAGTGGSVVATAISPGAWANSITWTLQNASNGDPAKRDLVFTITDPVTGTTTETYRNIAMGQAVLVNGSRLLASLAFSGTMTAWPANGTVNLGVTTAGSDGAAPTAADYQTALDQLANKANVRVVVADDCGDAIRGAVNTNIVTHCANQYDRVCFITGSPSNTWAQTKADKANYNSELATYCGAWVQVYDDAGVLRQTPLTTFCATARAMIPVHWSIANHDPQAVKFFANIKGIGASVPYSTASEPIRGEATANQIVLPIQLRGSQPGTEGPWGILHGRDCNLVSGYQYEVTTWYRIYLVTALASQLDPYTNGPNDLASGLEIQNIVNAFLDGEVTAKHLTPSKAPDGSLLPAYSTDIESVNSGATLANGDFYIAIDGHTPGVRERTILLLNVGETVSVRRAT
jgi:hypothetical protein